MVLLIIVKGDRRVNLEVRAIEVMASRYPTSFSPHQPLSKDYN